MIIPWRRVLLSLSVCCCVGAAHASIFGNDTPLQPPSPAPSTPLPMPSLAPMLERAVPGVVNISTRGKVKVRNPLLDSPFYDDPFFRRFFGQPDIPQYRETQSLGSGVIVDAKNGYIITNTHVVADAESITVTLNDERTLEAQVVGRDEETDVAVIKVKSERLVALPLADSDRLRVGDFVVAVGNPFGLKHTVTMGIVSALGRALPTDNDAYQDYIQTDASINPGNSGGALLDLQGRIVGINTAILSQSGGNIGIGFAVPINLANAIMHQLIEHGEVRRGQLGIMVQDLTPDLARYLKLDIQQGAIVAQVTPGSAAEQAGLRSEDVIVTVNDKPVRSARELRNTIGLMTIGDTVKLKVLRDGDTKTITAKIGKKQEQKLEEASGELHPALAGATLAPGAGRNGERGVLVQSLDPNSPAAYSGLQEKDLIVEVNRQPVKTLDDLAKAVKAGDGALLLKIRRGSATLLLFLR